MGLKLKFLVFFALMLVNLDVISQCTSPPNGAGCRCYNASVLCTPDELDGFVFTMSTTGNTGGLPTNDLCPGDPEGGVPNNVNWFAFIAWCTDLAIDVYITNCIDIPGGGPNYGVQIALFAGCPNPSGSWNPIQCLTEPGDACSNSSTGYPPLQNFVANGLTVGNTYYFMLDGCAGSACTVTLDVVGTCGNGTIDPWTQPIMGPDPTCVGVNNTYTAEDLDGATDFYWYLNGSPLISGDELKTINYTFSTEGTYTLCVDVSNDPCIPQANNPPQLCKTIKVYDAEAGNLSAAPNPTCPGNPINFSVANFNAGPNYQQYLYLANASGTIVYVAPGTSGSYTYDQCGTFTLYTLNFAPAGSVTAPVVGANVSSIVCATTCCDLKSLQLVWSDNQQPIFTNPPADITYNCYDLLPQMPSLDYTDNCIPSGTVSGNESGSANLCNGGVITRMWTISDACNNAKAHTQTITIQALPPPVFTTLPASVTINCNQIPSITYESLTYTNSGPAGGCLITGTVPPTVTGTATICGSTITKMWTFTDVCNRTINHTQTITINPSAAPQFVNPPPAAITLACDAFPTFTPQPLSYTNNDTGGCLIAGSVPPTVTGMAGQCGGSLTLFWTFTDACNRTITHTQVVTVTSSTPPVFINPPPAAVTLTCDQFTNWVAPTLSYTNNDNGVCLHQGTVSPTISGNGNMCGGTKTLVWTYTDVCARTITHTQIITITPPAIPTYASPPASLTMTCDQFSSFVPLPLTYTNNEPGACLYQGTVNPSISGNATLCGGTQTILWQVIDPCGRILSHTQTVTVTPMILPVYQNPPANAVTVDCNNIPTSAPNLTLTNGVTGPCGINVSVVPIQIGMANTCGGSFQYKWTYTDACGRLTDFIQTVTITPPPQAQFVNPPANEIVQCVDIPTSAPVLQVTNNATGNCLIEANIPPVMSGSASACGGTITYTWTYTDQCNRITSYVKTVTVVPAPQGSFINPPANMFVTCDMIPTGSTPLVITNGLTGTCAINATVPPSQNGAITACGGAVTYTWTHTDACGRINTVSQTITGLPTPLPVFDTPPPDITVDCVAIPATGIPLSYTNNQTGICAITGSVNSTRTGSITYCGGTLIDNWTYTDPCGRIITATRNITVTAAPPATFPDQVDITISCDQIPAANPMLTYSNGFGGPCLITGQVTAIKSGNITGCGGTFVYTWIFTDQCGRTITEVQNVTVSPAPTPYFINPPPDQLVPCGGTYTPPQTLLWSNEVSSPCLLSGNAFLTSTPGNNSIINTWEFVNPCTGAVVIHTQIVTFSVPPNIVVDPFFIDLCLGDSYDLVNIDVTDQNNTNPTYTYHTGLPADASNQIDPLISPTENTVYYINATNSQDCEDVEIINVFVFTPTNAGADNETTACSGGVPLNLFNYLSPDAQTIGSWFDDENTGINISNPYSVNLIGIPEGSYQLYYRIAGTAPCMDDEMVLTIHVIDEITFDILDVSCTGIGTFYEITVFPNGYDIFTTAGTVVVIDPDTVKIINIPIGTDVFITAIEPVSFCFADIFISSPDCACPDIAPPTGTEFYQKCTYEVPFAMTVNAGLGLQASWFATAGGTTPLASSTSSYNHNNAVPGVYNYFVEAFDPITMCKSDTRLKIVVEVVGLPITQNVVAAECDNNGDGVRDFDLLEIATHITNNASNTTIFYLTNANAQSGTSPLVSPYSSNSPGQIIYAATTNTVGCKIINTVTLNALPAPPLSLVSVDETCLGAKDGSINASYSGPNGPAEFSFDNGNWSSNFMFTGLSPDTFTVAVRDTNSCITSKTAIVKEGLSIIVKTFSVVCNNNGTSSDSGDDFYTLTFLIENTIGKQGNFKLIGDNGYSGVFSYYSPHTINITALDQTVNFTIQDEANGCSSQRIVGPLTPCSTDCIITLTEIMNVCNDNNTSTNPADDYHTVTLKASAINGSTTGTFNLFIDNVLKGGYTYLSMVSINILADNTVKQIKLVDSDDAQCQATKDVGPLNTCSDQCIMDAEMTITCSNIQGSPETNDDVYTIKVFAKLTNGGSSNTYKIFLDGQLNSTKNYGDTLTFTITSDNAIHTIKVEDSLRPECTETISTPLLVGCSAPCIIDFNILSENCFNPNNTSPTGDDYFEITIQPTIQGTVSTKCTVYAGGVNVGIATYGLPFVITLPADGNSKLLEIVDNLSSSCKISHPTSNLTPCSEPCEIMVTTKNIICDNNGTNNTDADDTYSFILRVDGNGQIWEIPSTTFTGQYGIDIIYQDLPISGGDINWRIRNKNNIGCYQDISIVAPPNCSECVQVVDAGQGGIITCANPQIQLLATSSHPGNFTWTNSSGQVSSTLQGIAVTADTYVFTASFSDGCVASDSVEVNVDANVPQVDAGPDKQITCIQLQVTLGGDQSSEGPLIRYEWTNAVGLVIGTTKYITVSQPGDYFLQLFNDISNCNTGKDKVVVTENKKQPLAIIYATPKDLFDCVVKVITLSTNVEMNVENTWLANGESFTQPTLDVREEGTYYLIALDTVTGCEKQSSIVLTDFQQYPQTELNVDDVLDCITKQVNIYATGSQTGSNILYKWQFQNGSTLSSNQVLSIAVNMPGDYYLILTDTTNGCINIDTVTVEKFENDINLTLIPSLIIKPGEDISLSLSINIDTSLIKTILWKPDTGLSCTDCLTPTIINAQPGTYSVEVEDIYGCRGQAEIRLIREIIEIIDIPNVIDPTSTTNNGFTVYGNEEVTEILLMRIYDRWGNMMFAKTNFAPNDPQLGWDGKFNDREIAQGVYVYLIELLMKSGEKRIFTGDVTVLR